MFGFLIIDRPVFATTSSSSALTPNTKNKGIHNPSDSFILTKFTTDHSLPDIPPLNTPKPPEKIGIQELNKFPSIPLNLFEGIKILVYILV